MTSYLPLFTPFPATLLLFVKPALAWIPATLLLVNVSPMDLH
jgi:hypothetical protein